MIYYIDELNLPIFKLSTYTKTLVKLIKFFHDDLFNIESII